MEINPNLQTENTDHPLTNSTYVSDPTTCNNCVHPNKGCKDPLSSLSDDDYFASMPPGFRFVPSEDELILHYLNKKINNEKLPRNQINVLNLYAFNPEELANYKPAKHNTWYFFTPRTRKYRNGQRPNRAANKGYWKATGADKTIKHKDKIIGHQKALVFYKGKPPKGEKTSWIMQEFRAHNPPPCKRRGENDMKLDDWVLCRVYNNEDKSGNKTRRRAKSDKNQAEVGKEKHDQVPVLMTTMPMCTPEVPTLENYEGFYDVEHVMPYFDNDEYPSMQSIFPFNQNLSG